VTFIFGTACAPGEDAEEEEDSTAGFSGYFLNPFMSGLETPASFGEIKDFDDKIMTPQHGHQQMLQHCTWRLCLVTEIFYFLIKYEHNQV